MMNKSKYLIVVALFLSCEGPLFEIPPEPDTTAPMVVITNPADNATLSDSVLITIYASDNDEVKLVQLFINDSLVLDSIQEPYEYEWDTKKYLEDEYHNIRARAVDYADNDNQTSPVRVMVDNNDNIKPTGSLLYPFSGQVLNGLISIIAEADDNDSLKSVVFYINGDSVAVKTSSPFIYDWDTTQEFDDYFYVINVKVNDASGNHITLGPISVYVDNEENILVDTTPPTGAITYPPLAAVVSGNVTIQVDAFDNEKVEKVEIVIDGSFSVIDENAPYEYIWNTTTYSEDMDHFIAATVTDSSGNTTNLMPVTVFVNNEIDIIVDVTPPSVVITNPAANQTVSGVIDVTAAAYDDIAIEKVEFYHNGELYGTDNTFPHQVSWNTQDHPEESEHIWNVKAFDTSNQTAQSQSIAVYVNNEDNILPTGFIAQPYAGQSVSGTVEILVSASDNIGVSSVDLYINGENIVSLSESPYTYSWNTENYTEDNEHDISAKVNDLEGNFFNIQPITVMVNNDPSVNDNIPPVVSILSPVSGMSVSDSVEVKIFAQDNHEVEQVLLIIDTLETTLTDSPYVYIFGTNEYPNGTSLIIGAIAFDSSGNQSNAQSISVTVDNEYYETINDLVVIQGTGTLTLNWDSPFGAESYKIYKDGSDEFFAQTGENTYVDSLVTPGVIYCYQIAAVNSIQIEGPRSESECNKALIPAPLNLNGSASQNTIALTWSPVTEASQYKLYRNEDQIYLGEEETFSDTGLEFNTNYSYTVSSLDNNGDEGPESSPISITTNIELTAAELSLSVNALEFTLNWSSVQGAASYRIFKNGDFLEETENLTYLFTSELGIETCFTVKAVDSHGNVGPESNQECGTGTDS